MRVFVTGGSGLVGRGLIPMLLDRGDQVLCVSRDPFRAKGSLPAAVEWLGADPALPGDWQDRLGTCDAVVNLAGESVGSGRWSGKRKHRIRRSRLSTTSNIAEAIAQMSGPITLVSASAVGFYGNREDEALPEDSQPGSGFLARLAVEWEHSASQAQRDNVRVALIRIGVVLAADGGALPKMLAPFRLGLGGNLGSGRQYFPWIHLIDLARCFLFALDNENIRGPVNAVVPDPPRQREFAKQLGTALGKPTLLPTPAAALRMLMGEQADLVLAGQRAVPNVLKAQGFKFQFPDLTKAFADLL